MALIISCLAHDEAHARRILDRLRELAWPPASITVLHAGEPVTAVTDEPAALGAQAAVAGGAPAAAAAGAFGWLVGFGVLAIPSALLGAAVGGAAGAAIGGSSDADEVALRRSVLGRYEPHVRDGSCAVLVRADDAKGYDQVVGIFSAERADMVQVVGKGRLEAGAARQGPTDAG